MNFLYYIIGGILTIVTTVVYQIFRVGSVQLTQNILVDLSIQAAIAVVSFAIADFIVSRKKSHS